ncbi:MAG TPA: hypothetical protein VLA49_13770 [Anaerolineales bacterium]|nr:hypothetical protein [Anaerolineales bacterium]
MASDNERRFILEMIESGKISAEEGLRLIQALGEGEEADAFEHILETPQEPENLAARPSFQARSLQDPQPPAAHFQDEPASADEDDFEKGDIPSGQATLPGDVDQWRRWWMIPLWVGVGFTVLAGVLMFWAQQAAGFGFWFYCSWVPFLLGLFLIVLAWQSRTARWLHLRVQQKEGEWPRNIAISFPLPIHLTAWFFRLFGNKIPGLQDTSLDEMILALDKTATPDNPLYVKVDEGEDGERVEVFIG